MKICSKCSLPIDVCVCESINTEIIIKIIERKGKKGKKITIIQNLEGQKDHIKFFKKKLCCGGHIRNGNIELQGYHGNKIIEILKEKGFSEKELLYIYQK
jgi:translation initiation factor 1